MLIDKKREKLIDEIINIFSDKVDEYLGIKKVTVETALPMDEKEKDRLLKQLNEIMKSKIKLNTVTRQDMLGGVIIRDRLHLIDVSVNQFLNSMRRKLSETRISNYKKVVNKNKIDKADKKREERIHIKNIRKTNVKKSRKPGKK